MISFIRDRFAKLQTKYQGYLVEYRLRAENVKKLDFEFEIADYLLVFLAYIYPLVNYLIELQYPASTPSTELTKHQTLVNGMFTSLLFMILRFSVLVKHRVAIVFFIILSLTGLHFRLHLATAVFDWVNLIGNRWSFAAFASFHCMLHFARVISKQFILAKVSP